MVIGKNYFSDINEDNGGVMIKFQVDYKPISNNEILLIVIVVCAVIIIISLIVLFLFLKKKKKNKNTIQKILNINKKNKKTDLNQSDSKMQLS